MRHLGSWILGGEKCLWGGLEGQRNLWLAVSISRDSSEAVNHCCVSEGWVGSMESWLHITITWDFYLQIRASVVAQVIKNLPAIQETQIWSLGREDPLEKGMATHSSNSCLENSLDRESWQATVHGVAKSRIRLSDFHSLSNSYYQRLVIMRRPQTGRR